MKDDPKDLIIERQLDRWARTSPAKDASKLVNELAGIHRAARHVVDAIDMLVAERAAPREQGQALLEIGTWLLQELRPHITHIPAMLDKVISQTYEQVPAEEEPNK